MMGSDARKLPAGRSSRGEIDAFLRQIATTPRRQSDGRGRLIFALDATMSRQPTWDRALAIQAEMFDAAAALGGLDIQLVYFRGHGEFRASHWARDAAHLRAEMTGVACRGGLTQIEKVLRHARDEARRGRVDALVYVGDAMEERIDPLCALAGEIGLVGLPVFLFQEGRAPAVEAAFREIARLTRGAYCRFDAGSTRQLRELLGAVAVYAVGGRKALADYGARHGEAVKRLIHQLG
jgi:hypothetical protein